MTKTPPWFFQSSGRSVWRSMHERHLFPSVPNYPQPILLTNAVHPPQHTRASLSFDDSQLLGRYTATAIRVWQGVRKDEVDVSILRRLRATLSSTSFLDQLVEGIMDDTSGFFRSLALLLAPEQRHHDNLGTASASWDLLSHDGTFCEIPRCASCRSEILFEKVVGEGLRKIDMRYTHAGLISFNRRASIKHCVNPSGVSLDGRSHLSPPRLPSRNWSSSDAHTYASLVLPDLLMMAKRARNFECKATCCHKLGKTDSYTITWARLRV